MDNNLTLNSLAFNLRYSDKDSGSERREISRGVNLPEILTIKSQKYTDSSTKIPGRRTVVRVDRHQASAAGDIVTGLSAYVVVTIPEHEAVGTSDVQAVITRILTLLAGTTVTGGLDLKDEIFVNGEQ